MVFVNSAKLYFSKIEFLLVACNINIINAKICVWCNENWIFLAKFIKLDENLHNKNLNL
jgi:hypothetical protein